MEVTFKEVRAYLDVETQRQWSDTAIARSTPSLLALFSIVALWADKLHEQQKLPTEQTTWYQKQRPAFSDALAAVRSSICQENYFCTSTQNEDMVKIPKPVFDHVINLLG